MTPRPPLAPLQGERVLLRPLEPADAPRLAAFTQDRDVRAALGVDRPLRADEEAALVQALPDARDEIALGVVALGSGRLVGVCGLHGLASGEPELGIFVGEPRDRGGGLGSEALRILLGHAFEELRLERIRLEVEAGNAAALRVFGRAGFAPEPGGARGGRIAMALGRADWAGRARAT